MNSLTVSNDIFNNKQVVLDYLVNSNELNKIHIDHVNWIQLRISESDNEEKFLEFIDILMDKLKIRYDLFLLYAETEEHQKSKVRSVVKLFYPQRKKNIVKEGQHLEKEVEVSKDKSIMQGIIQINDIDNDTITEELMKISLFQFGYGIEKSNSHNSLDKISSKLEANLFDTSNTPLSKKYISIINQLISPTSFTFSYMYDGKDDLLFTVYCGNELTKEIEQLIANSIGVEGLEKKEASKEDIDQLITRYFADWRRAG